MAHQTTNWQAWKPEIDAYIQDEEANQPKSAYKQIFSVNSTDRLQINDVGWAGMGPMESVGELGDAVEDESQEGYQTPYNMLNYRKYAKFSSNLMRTDQSGVTENLARDLARVPEYTRDLNLFSVLRRAFDTTLTLGSGVQLISTVVPRKDGEGTQTNTLSGGVQSPLTYDTALEAQDVLLALLSNSGNILGAGDASRNKLLIVGPYLREDAFQIAGVQGPDQEPDSAENNMNYFRKGDKFDVLVTKFISYEAAVQAGETTVSKTSTSNYWDSMWFVADVALMKRSFKLFVQEGYPYYDDEITKSNEAMLKYVYDMYAYGVSSNLVISGSKGDSSTFSS